MKEPAKAEMKWQIANLEAELTQRRNIGAQMATLCRCLSHRKGESYKDIARELHKRWEAIEELPRHEPSILLLRRATDGITGVADSAKAGHSGQHSNRVRGGVLGATCRELECEDELNQE